MKGITRTVALSVVLATPALATDGNWQLGNDQVHVVDSRINVASAAGRLQLLERVEQAAKKLCHERVGSFREQCEVDTVRQTAAMQTAWGRALALALEERGAPQMAAR